MGRPDTDRRFKKATGRYGVCYGMRNPLHIYKGNWFITLCCLFFYISQHLKTWVDPRDPSLTIYRDLKKHISVTVCYYVTSKVLVSHHLLHKTKATTLHTPAPKPTSVCHVLDRNLPDSIQKTSNLVFMSQHRYAKSFRATWTQHRYDVNHLF